MSAAAGAASGRVAAPGPAGRRRTAGLVLAAGLTLYVTLSLASMRHESSTFDESVHLPPGYAGLTLGDYWIEPYHPPLVRSLAALPLLALDDVRLDTADPTLRRRLIWGFGERFLWRWNDGERLVRLGRLPVIALAATLAAALFLFTRRRWGLLAGGFALLLCVLEPGFLAHGRAITTDMGVTVFLFLTVAAFERLTAEVTWPRLLAAGAALGGTLTAKFSGVLVLPMLGLLGLVVACGREPLPVALGRGRRELSGRASRLLAVAGLLLAMGIVAAGAVWAAYGFRSSPQSGVAGGLEGFPWSRVAVEQPLVQQAITSARELSLLPQPWLYGLAHMIAGGHGGVAFLFGRESAAGWWYYFPVTFALKTPLPLLVLLAVAAVGAVRRLPGASPAERRLEAFLWLPPLVYLAVAMTQHVNLGNRHMLPVYPFAFVLAGRAAARLWQAPGLRRGVRRAAVGALLAWYAAANAAAYPHYLGFFNELAGGSAGGWRKLVDSNLDWGQGLVGLRRWMTAHGVERVTLSYFGTADPGSYGITGPRLPGFRPPPPHKTVWRVRRGEVVAVSATHLQGVYLDDALDPLLARLREREPLAVVGGSIFVYRVDFDWAAAPGERRRAGTVGRRGRELGDDEEMPQRTPQRFDGPADQP